METLMSFLGKLCNLFDFDDVEIDEGNREEFTLIATIWQDYFGPDEAVGVSEFLPDRIYFHLFESDDEQRCCYMNVVSENEELKNTKCDQIHIYNRMIIPWLAGKTTSEDMEKLQKYLEEEALKDKKEAEAIKNAIEDTSITTSSSIDELCEFIQYTSVLGLVAPIAEQFLKDHEAGKVQLNAAEVTEYMIRAYKHGLLKSHNYSENVEYCEKSYVIQLMRDVSAWFTEDGRDAACQNHEGQTTRYRTYILKEISELLAKMQNSEPES